MHCTEPLCNDDKSYNHVCQVILLSLYFNKHVKLPILNGRDSEGHVIYLGAQRTKINRYLLVIFLAKSARGLVIINSVLFTGTQ
jgi:hypothetical protein